MYIDDSALCHGVNFVFYLKLDRIRTFNCHALFSFDFQDCMNEVDSEEKRTKDEERAMKEVQSGTLAAQSIKELLQKLDRPDQNILYYTGGIRLLAGAVKDCKHLMQSLLIMGAAIQVGEYKWSSF